MLKDMLMDTVEIMVSGGLRPYGQDHGDAL